MRDFPLAGASRAQLAPNLRVVFEGNYAIYYRSEDDAIVIVRVLHGAGDVAALAQRGGFG